MAFFSIVEVLLVPVLGGRAQNITKIVLYVSAGYQLEHPYSY